MSMFTRNDKMPDANIDETARVRETPPVAAAPKPVQAMAQPLPTAAASRTTGVSVISKALKITGQLESTEDIRIDGEVDGDVRAVSVTVGSGAKVKGTVYGNAVELSGTIEGKIEAEKVVLTSSAHMSGDVVHQNIKIESGAFIAGHCRPEFGKTASAPKPTAAPLGLATQTKSSEISRV
jgi:cytoskeletal protein CcmA (bactofilin family)